MGVVFLFGFIALGVFGAVTWFQYRSRQKRRQELAAIAQSLGFQFSIADPERTTDLPFGLFEKGRRRGTENVMWGTHHDLPLKVFDYWYYEEQSDGRGGRTRQYYRFTCAIVTIAASCPPLRIGHEGFFSRIGNAMGFKDVELEYDDFNRAYRVHCDDQKFAFSLLDGQMMEWLLQDSGFKAIEVVGPWVLVAASKLPTDQWLPLTSFAEAFNAHIPRVVFSTWPVHAS
jgi:hypothetical protein